MCVCIVAVLLTGVMCLPLAFASESAVYGNQEIGVSEEEDDGLATGHASTKVTAHIVVPDSTSSEQVRPSETSATTQNVPQTGDGTVSISAIVALSAAAIGMAFFPVYLKRREA